MNRPVGIYIHVPFCKSRCRYCDFYSTTLLDRREEYVAALLREIGNRVQGIGYNEQSGPFTPPPLRGAGGPSTIYFGGGTPSLLTPEQISRILLSLSPLGERVPQGGGREATLEANPGDLSLEKLQALRAIGINRLSIGIQSFQDSLLRTIGRRHTAAEAISAVAMARSAGFDNLSIDLMYGLPGQTMAMWQADIAEALALRPEHISCYCLSYEEGTVLTLMLERGDIHRTDDDTANAMYDCLCDQLRAAGYEHYEVSNFALPGYRSRHNSNYWNDTPYIGLGAGAHSYDGRRRSWNISDLDAYCRGEAGGSELLTDEDRRTEKIMLGLRTCEGVDKKIVNRTHSEALLARGLLREAEGHYIATQQGLHILNQIILDLL